MRAITGGRRWFAACEFKQRRNGPRRHQPTNLPPSTGMTIPVLEVRWVTAAITA